MFCFGDTNGSKFKRGMEASISFQCTQVQSGDESVFQRTQNSLHMCKTKEHRKRFVTRKILLLGEKLSV
jgi:hypothetical protein